MGISWKTAVSISGAKTSALIANSMTLSFINSSGIGSWHDTFNINSKTSRREKPATSHKTNEGLSKSLFLIHLNNDPMLSRMTPQTRQPAI